MNIVLVSGYDWCGLFINDKLAVEGHSLSVSDVVNAINDNIKLMNGCEIMYEEQYCDGDWLEEFGSFPEYLTDCKLV